VERRTQAALALLFLSPAFGELVSGSSPPLEFFFPPSFLGLVALYGCGALLIREAAIKYDKGWPSLALWGAAYGVYEEGLAVKSWFDPGWMDLGKLGLYGRFAGVNWVWATSLTFYHATISIALPLFLLDVLFPDFKGKRLLSDRALRWPAAALGTIGLIFYLALPYRPGAEYLVAVLAAAALAMIGFEVPRDWLTAPAARPPRRASPFAVLGVLWFTATFVVFNAGVDFGWDPATTVAVGLTLTLAGPLILRGCISRGGSERFVFAFFAGTVGLLILFGLVLGTVSPAAFLGMQFVAVGAAAWLARVYWRNLPRWKAGEPPVPAPAANAGPATWGARL
jgi:hypothetical protein